MKEILNTIFTQIKNSITEPVFIATDLGQLQLEHPPVSFPCALVDIGSIAYNAYKGGGQLANATINVTLGFSVLGSDDIHSDSELREQAMAHYDLLSSIAMALNGFECDYFSPLVRQSLERGKDAYPRPFTLSFTTSWVESS